MVVTLLILPSMSYRRAFLQRRNFSHFVKFAGYLLALSIYTAHSPSDPFSYSFLVISQIKLANFSVMLTVRLLTHNLNP